MAILTESHLICEIQILIKVKFNQSKCANPNSTHITYLSHEQMVWNNYRDFNHQQHWSLILLSKKKISKVVNWRRSWGIQAPLPVISSTSGIEYKKYIYLNPHLPCTTIKISFNLKKKLFWKIISLLISCFLCLLRGGKGRANFSRSILK